MSTEHRPHGAAGEYEVRIDGRLTSRWSAWFDGMTVTADDDGTTVLRGEVVDQAALHGLLQKLRDVGVPLVSLRQVRPTTSRASRSRTAQGELP